MSLRLVTGSVEREQAEREAATRDQEQARLQAAYEQPQSIKEAGSMRGTFNRPLVYRIDDGNGPVIMTVSRVMAGGLDPGSKRYRQ